MLGVHENTAEVPVFAVTVRKKRLWKGLPCQQPTDGAQSQRIKGCCRAMLGLGGERAEREAPALSTPSPVELLPMGWECA